LPKATQPLHEIEIKAKTQNTKKKKERKKERKKGEMPKSKFETTVTSLAKVKRLLLILK